MYQKFPIQQINQDQLLEITKNSVFKDKDFIGTNVIEQIRKDDFLYRI